MSAFSAVDLSQFGLNFVESSGDQGGAFVTNKNVKAGKVIFREQPLITVTDEMINGPKAVEYEERFLIKRIYWAFYFQYQTLDAGIKEQMQLFYKSKLDTKPQFFHATLNAMPENLREEIDVEEIIISMIIFNYNMQHANFHNERAAVTLYFFYYGTRLTHSCSPNCDWRSLRDGSFVLRSIAPIAEGEELTVSYYPDNFIILPVSSCVYILKLTFLIVHFLSYFRLLPVKVISKARKSSLVTVYAVRMPAVMTQDSSPARTLLAVVFVVCYKNSQKMSLN
jgi:hypothetical protein